MNTLNATAGAAANMPVRSTRGVELIKRGDDLRQRLGLLHERMYMLRERVLGQTPASPETCCKQAQPQPDFFGACEEGIEAMHGIVSRIEAELSELSDAF